MHRERERVDSASGGGERLCEFVYVRSSLYRKVNVFTWIVFAA